MSLFIIFYRDEWANTGFYFALRVPCLLFPEKGVKAGWKGTTGRCAGRGPARRGRRGNIWGLVVCPQSLVVLHGVHPGPGYLQWGVGTHTWMDITLWYPQGLWGALGFIPRLGSTVWGLPCHRGS